MQWNTHGICFEPKRLELQQPFVIERTLPLASEHLAMPYSTPDDTCPISAVKSYDGILGYGCRFCG